MLLTPARLAFALLLFAPRPPEVLFEKTTIDPGAAEPAAFADVNGDKKLDIVSGEFWYQAPNWTPPRFREIPFLNNYVDDFSDLVADCDGDGRPDFVAGGKAGLFLFKNLGASK